MERDLRPHTMKIGQIYSTIEVVTKDKKYVFTIEDFAKKVQEFTGWSAKDTKMTIFLTPNREFDEKVMMKMFPGMTDWRSHGTEMEKIEAFYPSFIGKKARFSTIDNDRLLTCKGKIVDEKVEVDLNNCGRTINFFKFDEACGKYKKDQIIQKGGFDIYEKGEWVSSDTDKLLILSIPADKMTGRCVTDKSKLKCKITKVKEYFMEDEE